VPLGVDLVTFAPRVDPLPAEAARLVYAGRLSREKNPRPVSGAVRRLVGSGVAVRLDVYGEGPEHAALRWSRR
jgi:alpha-1,6-mannosyltransferase